MLALVDTFLQWQKSVSNNSIFFFFLELVAFVAHIQNMHFKFNNEQINEQSLKIVKRLTFRAINIYRTAPDFRRLE